MKRILSTILAISMILTFVFNFSVIADETELTVTSITAVQNTVKITFSDSVEACNDEDINNYIELLDENATEITYSIASKTENVLALSVDAPDYDKTYTVNIYAGFGNGTATLVENVSETITFVKLSVVDFYAGVGSVTVKYNGDLALEDAGEITVEEVDGKAIDFTASTRGNVLTIVPKESFVRDTVEYKVKVGTTVKNFKIKTIWEPTIDTEAGTVEGFKYGDLYATGKQIGVTPDGEIAYKGNQYVVFPDIDTNSEQYKNASFTFDAKYPGYNMNPFYGFNANKNTSDMAYLMYSSNGLKGNDAFAWRSANQTSKVKWHSRFYRIDTLSTAENKIRDVDYNIAPESSYPLTQLFTTVTYNENGTATVDNKVREAEPYHYSIDKTGSLGTLILNNQLIDRYETQDYFPDKNATYEYGYFFFGSDYDIVLSNMAITVCEIVPGEPVVTDITDFYAGTGSVTVKYGTALESVTDVGKIKLEDSNGNVINTTASVKGNVLTIVPEESFVRDTAQYKITIGNKVKNFKIKTVWEPETDYASGTVSGLKTAEANGLDIGVAEDGSIAVKAQCSAIYPDINTNSPEYKNASFSFDVIYSGSNTYSIFGFNTADNTSAYMAYGTAAGSKTAYMWFSQNQGNGIYHQRIYQDKTYGLFNVANPNEELKPEVSLVLERWGATTTITDGKASFNKELSTAKKYHYSIDKTGSFGTLIVDNKLIDRFNTQDYMPEGGSAPEYGYFMYGAHWIDNVVLSNMAITVCEIVPGEPVVENITEFYAGAASVTVKYDQNFDLEDLGVITLEDSKGKTINTTAYVKDNVLTLVPSKKFTRDSEIYKLTIGNTIKRFVIKTIWEPTIDKEAGTIEGFKYGDLWASGKQIGVTPDGEIAYKGDQYVVFPDIDTNSEQYKNASFTFDAKYPGSNLNSFYGFNANKNTSDMSYLMYKDQAIKGNDAFAWRVWNQSAATVKWHSRAYRIDTLSTDENKIRDVDYNIEPESSYPLTQLFTTVTYNENGTATVDNKVREAEPYHYSIDKVGSLGTLILDNQLIDRYETQDYFPNNNAAYEYGYFFFGSDIDIVLSNMAITVCEEVGGSIEVQGVTYLGADNAVLENVAGQPSVHGQVTVESTFNANKPVKIAVAAYSGDYMIDIDVLTADSVNAWGSITGDYSFENLTGLTEIRVLVWDSLGNMYPYCAAVSSTH